MTETCTLCGLSTPDPPVSGADVEGTFCCRGCLEVATAVDSVDGVDTEAVRERSQGEDVEPPEQSSDLSEAFLAIDGMHCTTCESFVALRGESHDGVESVEASYATDTARVRYDPSSVSPAFSE
jgi:Cu2+-exporting ATPase